MSDVLKRECFYEIVDGTIRPFEWARVNVEGFGMMVEPYWPFETTTGTTDDFSNDFQRVDEFVETDEAGVIKALNGGSQETWMTGGRHYPRTGR